MDEDNVGLGHFELALDFGAELLEALRGAAGPGSGLGQPLGIGVGFAHVGCHRGGKPGRATVALQLLVKTPYTRGFGSSA